jgi:hypothetical protein
MVTIITKKDGTEMYQCEICNKNYLNYNDAYDCELNDDKLGGVY